ncbi:trehalose-phosphatase [Nocardioides montaniterrae]
MDFSSPEGEQAYAALVQVAAGTVVGLDFDGTLAPIVDDPTRAFIHPDTHDVLVDLASEVAAVAIITGRPARQVMQLGGLAEVGERISALGKELLLFGQYGNERWSTRDRRIIAPRPARGMASFDRELPGVLRKHDAADAYVEDKGLGVAVHTRRMADPRAAYDRILPPLLALAEKYGLTVEPGRNVVEIRSPGADKGLVVEGLVYRFSPRGFLFAGDDLGDMDAFDMLGRLASEELAVLRVCSGSDEEGALVPVSDLVVPGPRGVLDLLRSFTVDARRARLTAPA